MLTLTHADNNTEIYSIRHKYDSQLLIVKLSKKYEWKQEAQGALSRSPEKHV